VCGFASPTKNAVLLCRNYSGKNRKDVTEGEMTSRRSPCPFREYVKRNLVKHMLSSKRPCISMPKIWRRCREVGVTGAARLRLGKSPHAGRTSGLRGTILRRVRYRTIYRPCSPSHHTGIPRQTRMEKPVCLDEVTGLITAVALVPPSRSLLDWSQFR